ncbi:alpha/beta hydrolase [bacterium]|nr:alpha/beta hydrolase [bacterium]
MKKVLIVLIGLILCGSCYGVSVRSLGMGNVYPLTARDPSGIFYNPAYLAKSDSIRLSFDNIYGPVLPRNNIAMSIGDLGIARSSATQGAVYYVSHGFNTYSFLRLGVGVKVLNGQKDFDIGFDADITKNIALSAALLNEENAFLPRKSSATIAYKTEDSDKCLALKYDFNGNVRVGYENQFTSKAFWRVGYNIDHPAAGLTLPIGEFVDLDLAADFAKDSSKILFGVNLFRNTENKRVNSNHSINFDRAIVGEDKFIEIEGFNIHYVEAGTGEPFVLIGGGIHYTHHWDPYMKELSKKYRVINIDHIGAGESDKPNYFFGYTIEEQGEIIHELLNRIGVKQAYLLGYCYGGSIAFYLAGQYPDKYKKLVIIEGFVRGINTIPLADRNRENSRKARHDIEYLNAYLLRDYITWNYRLLYPYFNSKMWYQLNKAVLYADLGEKIKNTKASVLYYSGTKSWAYEFLGPTKDYIKENIKKLKFVEIEGAGHDVDRFDQSRFLSEIIYFLRNNK